MLKMGGGREGGDCRIKGAFKTATYQSRKGGPLHSTLDRPPCMSVRDNSTREAHH